jgi:predicted DNA-binding ribbon-helix-helix protein
VKVVIPVSEYKRFIQNQFEKVKSTASDLISSRNDAPTVIELEAHAYEQLNQIAASQHTSIQGLVNHIIDQHLSTISAQSLQIPVEKKEENPILYLDAICKIEA